MSSKGGEGWGTGGGIFAYRMLGSLVLMFLTPVFCMALWYICYYREGSATKFYEEDLHVDSKFASVEHILYNLVPKIIQWPFGTDAVTCKVWKYILYYMAFELILMRFVPGKTFHANMTKTGHVPVYVDNGVACYFISIAALFGLYKNGTLEPLFLYDNFGLFLSCMNAFALVFCTFLSIKGLTFPSTKDSGSNGSLIEDFFWGTELYPNILGFDVKQFTNCRFGLMYWQVGILCYALAQYEKEGFVSSSMVVSVLIQSVYILKFFWWETGYFNSMDIQHDRAGYYICWGCLVWVPSVYTMHTYFLVNHPILLSAPVTFGMLVVGLACVYCNYDCDRQRIIVRATDGKCKVWGRPPVIIRAKYINETGEEKKSILLASGWWGMASHFHYLFEIGAAFCWCVPALFEYPLPYFYPFFLTLLLLDRSFRDDDRCAEKYKEYWVEYRKKVPYNVIPGVI